MRGGREDKYRKSNTNDAAKTGTENQRPAEHK